MPVDPDRAGKFANAQDKAIAENAQRVFDNQRFHQQASQKMGLLIPLYIYPANIHTNADYNRVMELKRQYSEVPFWVIVNPASGPGTEVDANYTKAIDRLVGAGCVVLGYVPTSYGKIPANDVQRDLDAWRRMYPRVHGIFYDEMIYEDTTAAVDHQKQLNVMAHHMGYWPTVGNPGTATPGGLLCERSGGCDRSSRSRSLANGGSIARRLLWRVFRFSDIDSCDTDVFTGEMRSRSDQDGTTPFAMDLCDSGYL